MTVTVENGSFSYRNSARQILDNIHFSVSDGDVLAILGPNGAGKTTLLRCITGLLQWQSGQTLIDGVPISEIPQKKLWRRLSYVPQAKTSVSGYTVEEMVLLGRSAYVSPFSLPKESDMTAADSAIKRAGIDGIRKRSCSEISGGEYQMTLIARALASEPEALILDEPESSLDFKNQLLVLDTITRLANEGIVCIFNTHYPAHALRKANKALMLSKSGGFVFGPAKEIITETNIKEYFGVRSVIGELSSDGEDIADVIPICSYDE